MTFLDVASQTCLSLGDEGWAWIERASWIAAILGLVAVGLAILQIRQLVRRPSLKIGFPLDPGGAGERLVQVSNTANLPVHWPDGVALSDPIELSVVAQNEMKATATASDVNLEVRYPPWLEPHGMGDLKRPPGMDLWSLAKEGIVLNPDGMYWMRAGSGCLGIGSGSRCMSSRQCVMPGPWTIN